PMQLEDLGAQAHLGLGDPVVQLLAEPIDPVVGALESLVDALEPLVDALEPLVHVRAQIGDVPADRDQHVPGQIVAAHRLLSPIVVVHGYSLSIGWSPQRPARSVPLVTRWKISAGCPVSGVCPAGSRTEPRKPGQHRGYARGSRHAVVASGAVL